MYINVHVLIDSSCTFDFRKGHGNDKYVHQSLKDIVHTWACSLRLSFSMQRLRISQSISVGTHLFKLVRDVLFKM
jgi:hypothetical protein